MDIMIILQKKGVSGLRELTQNLVNNLNFRQINLREYERWGGFLNCTLKGDETITVENSVKDSEIHKYLQTFFGVDNDTAKEILNNLIEMGFMKITRHHSEYSMSSGWNKTVTPMI